MKLTSLFLFVMFCQVSATVFSQNNGRLSLKAEQETISSILQLIEDQSDYSFLYNSNNIDVDRKTDINYEGKSIEEVLQILFKDTNVKFRTFKSNYVLYTEDDMVTSGQMQQNKTVTGKVTDSSGAPLPGVTVVVKGTTTGIITDFDGKYSLLKVPADGTLVFSFVGMKAQEIQISGRLTINVTMEEDAIGIEEVVAVGYGVMKKRDITGSVASISGEQISAIPVSNVAQALTGRLSGVNVVSQDGRPDASVSIRVRGGGSISQSNEPLFIVDGFPVNSINDIPGNQIESIDVLKDASSTAIYGARGANGVIIITTKSGKSGKLTVSYDGYMQFNTPTKYLETMNAYDYIAYNWGYAKAIGDTYNDAWERLWGIGNYADTYNNAAGIDHYKNVAATNFSKNTYSDSFSHNHNLNISNGNEKTKYIISLNHVDNDGLKINSGYKRTSASFKLDQVVSDNLNFSIDTRFTSIYLVGDEKLEDARGSDLSSAYWFRPIATADVLGELNDSKNTSLGMYDDILQDLYNPVARIKDYTPEQRNRTLRANTSLDWTIIKGLIAKTELGLSAYWNRENTWSGAIYNQYINSDGNKTYGGDATIKNNEGWNMRWVNTLNYQVQGLGDNQNLNILAGQEITNSGSEGTSIWGKYYPASFDAERAFAMMDQYGTTTGTVNSGYSSYIGTPDRLQSYFGRLNYSLYNRYLLTATFRADGSSKFAPRNRWGYFPAAALGWRISEEDFMKDINWLDNLKLRLSYGAVGNDGINANLWNMKWKSDGLTQFSVNEQRQVAYSPASSTIANPNLKWETTITRNLGLDYTIFNNRVYGTIDLYSNSTKDLLMLTPISSISGFSSTYENIGSTSNKGFELAIGGDIVRSKDFNISANFNINFNRGKIEELADGIDGRYNTRLVAQPSTGDYILVEGKPVGQVRGYTYDGWYSVDDFNYSNGIYTLKGGIADISSGLIGTVYGTNAHKPSGQVAYPGVVKYRDISGPNGTPDGVIDENDVSVIGDMNPKHTGGLSISGNYKNFDFLLGFNWSYGNKIYNANYLNAFYGSKETGLYRNRYDYLSTSYRIYDIQGDQIVSVTDPAALSALNANATTFLPYHEFQACSTMGLEDGSYLRLNTVTLGYNISKSLVNSIGLSKIRVYGSIYNAFVLTNYSGLDPEVNTNTNMGGALYPTPGLDWGTYPRARSFTFGVNVEF